MAKQPTKIFNIDSDDVTNFLEDYDYWGGDGWVTEILNQNIDLELMRKAVISHAVGNKEAVSYTHLTLPTNREV